MFFAFAAAAVAKPPTAKSENYYEETLRRVLLEAEETEKEFAPWSYLTEKDVDQLQYCCKVA